MNKSEGGALALHFIKSAIDLQRLSRFDLGQQLYQGYKQSNLWSRKPQSVTSFRSGPQKLDSVLEVISA